MNPSSQTYAGVLDLPDEILLLILTHVDSDYLYRLSFLCRRFHHLALDMYFNRERIIITDSEDPHIKTLDFCSMKSMAALPAVICYLFMPPIECIRAKFGAYVAPRERIVEDVRGIGRLVSKHSTLQKISIDHAEVFSADDEWVKALEELLNTAAEKSILDFYVSGGELVAWPFIDIDVPNTPVEIDGSNPTVPLSILCRLFRVLQRFLHALKRFLHLKVRYSCYRALAP